MGAEGGMHTAPKHITYAGECTACGANIIIQYQYSSIQETH